MPITINEKLLRFRFDDTWAVIKYDDHRDYLERIQHLPETKGVDFVAVLDERFLYFIEAKDFRGHRIENRARVITPATKKVIDQPDAPARDPVVSPRWRVGLLCGSMRNFLAGAIKTANWP
jgi:hypothetical protein